MADDRWYDSRKGWATAVVGGLLWALDQWGRAGAAVEIYQQLPGWLLLASPYIAPLFFLGALAFFEARRRSGGEATPKGKKAVKQKEINWRLVSYGLLIAVLCAASAWIITRPNMYADVQGSSIGELADASPVSGIFLHITLRNVGPPTTTNDWQMTVKLSGGASFSGTLVKKGVLHYAERHLDKPYMAVDPREFIWKKTEQDPIATGGATDGYIGFLFYGLTREQVATDSIVTLKWKDARKHAYETTYPVPAKKNVMFFTPGTEDLPMPQTH